MRARDISSRRFSKLTAICRVDSQGATAWRCQCECGAEIVVRTSNLLSGNTKSCGCYRPDIANGWAKTPEYRAFWNAKNRCEREKDIRFRDYGGRGIQFRFSDMASFIACVGPRPSPAYSLDRINSDGHYAPGNVRWATIEIQARNKRTSIMIEIDGVTRNLKEWCEIYDQKYRLVWERMRGGADAATALTRPLVSAAARRTSVIVEAV